MRAKLDHVDEGPVVDTEGRCLYHLQEGRTTRLQECGSQKGPSSQLLQGGLGCRDRPHPGQVLRGHQHPVTERGRGIELRSLWPAWGTWTDHARPQLLGGQRPHRACTVAQPRPLPFTGVNISRPISARLPESPPAAGPPGARHRQDRHECPATTAAAAALSRPGLRCQVGRQGDEFKIGCK